MALDTYENYKIAFVPSVASIAAPTAAEIGAGTEVTEVATVAGVNIGSTQNMAATALLGQAYIPESPGTHGKSMTLEFVRHQDVLDDVAWTAFNTYKEAGFVIIGEFGSLAAASRCSVYQVQVGVRQKNPSTENAHQRFIVSFGIEAFNEDAVVA